MQEADPADTHINEEYPNSNITPHSGRTLGDHSDNNKYWNLISIQLEPTNWPDILKQTIRFIEAYYPKWQIDWHFDNGVYKTSEHISSTFQWTKYNQTNTMDLLLLTWGAPFNCTPKD